MITVTVTPAQHAALALHSLAVAHDPAIDDDEDDAVIAAALVGRRLRYDPADADRLWSALNDLANRIDSAIIDGHSSDRRADRAAERSIARLARAVLAGSR